MAFLPFPSPAYGALFYSLAGFRVVCDGGFYGLGMSRFPFLDHRLVNLPYGLLVVLTLN